ncbi:MAG: ferritin family protein [Phycisphaerae bacterium]
MSELVDTADLMRVAIEDEKTGVVFYAALAGRAADPAMRKLLAGLSEQEKAHQKRFEKLLASLGRTGPWEEYPGQYIAYLRALTGARAFPDEQTALRAAGDCPDDAAALNLAMRYERDTLMLMNELRGLLGAGHREAVEEVIAEERSHIVVLTEALAKPVA